MNPFLNKSLSELKAMTPGLADPELDALCAAVCDEEWVKLDRVKMRRTNEIRFLWKRYYFFSDGPNILLDVPRVTSDWREAGRLLVKYRLIVWPDSIQNVPIKLWFSSTRWQFNKAANTNPCRAIADAAVVAGLTGMIEEKRGRRNFILDF